MQAVLENSKFFSCTLSFGKKMSSIIKDYLKAGIFKESLEALKKDLSFAPFKKIGPVLIIAVLVNAFLNLLLANEIKLMDLIIWALLLFVGIGGQFSNANWQVFKRSSLILKLFL